MSILGSLSTEGTDPYWKLYNYGKKKTSYSWDMYIILGFMSGIWLGIWATVSTRAGGLYYNYDDPFTGATANLVYGALFPGGLLAIMFTASELYTGNVAAMFLFLMHERSWKAFGHSMIVCGMSLIMNCLGCLTAAYFLAYLPGLFKAGPPADFLLSLAEKKMGYDFYQAFLLGVSCNTIVCLAVFVACQADSMIAKGVLVWLFIACFCWGGFEHLIANFYTIPLGLMVGESSHYKITQGVGDMMTKNWLPVFLGNTLGGILFTALVWWYTMRPFNPEGASKKLEEVEALSDDNTSDEEAA